MSQLVINSYEEFEKYNHSPRISKSLYITLPLGTNNTSQQCKDAGKLRHRKASVQPTSISRQRCKNKSKTGFTH